MDPPLTVVDIDTYKLGEEAANTLFSIIQDPNQDRKEVLLPTRIIERESTMKGENRKK
jgi:DNA-binding LacI/PurR family transcriptional regulator